MGKRKRIDWMFWSGRVLAIVFALFLEMFALDVFSEGYTAWELIVALFMHSLPSLILAIVIVLTWKRGNIAAYVFAVLGVVTIFFFKTYEDIINFCIVSLPVFVVAALYYLGHRRRKGI